MVNQLDLWPKPASAVPLRWSVSRSRRLRDCARRYYLYHYGSRGGRRPDAAARLREIYILKQLSNRYMWVGEITHELIELALTGLRQGRAPLPGPLRERGIRRMRAQFAESRQGVYRTRPGQALGLVEHEYSEAVDAAQWQQMRTRLERCLTHFFAMPLVREVLATPAWCWLALEATGSFDLDGATITVKPDFAWRNAHGQVELVDWKTGAASDEGRDQLAVYGLFAQRVWGLGSANMLGHLAYLDDGHVESFELDADLLAQAEAQVRASVAQMRQLAPVGAQDDEAAALAAFPMTDNLRQCARCSFRRICERG